MNNLLFMVLVLLVVLILLLHEVQLFSTKRHFLTAAWVIPVRNDTYRPSDSIELGDIALRLTKAELPFTEQWLVVSNK